MANTLTKYLPNNFSEGRFGHSFGLQLTEPPSITFNNNLKLELNMVLTLEPFIEFMPGKMLVHEENIVIRENGVELLTNRAPYKIVEIN
jgi:Xaa-Pro aminopeptidase